MTTTTPRFVQQIADAQAGDMIFAISPRGKKGTARVLSVDNDGNRELSLNGETFWLDESGIILRGHRA